MTHYGNNKTHTCDEDEHNWKEAIDTQSVSIVIRDGQPYLKCRWSTKYECTQTGEKYMRSGTHKDVRCKETKSGTTESVCIPISELEQLDR